MRTLVISDIHGAYDALSQCLEGSNFNKQLDRLICLGDVCDRGLQVKDSIDELLSIRHCIYILGNHDAMCLEWAIMGKPPEGWLEEGGLSTVNAYGNNGLPKKHLEFLANAQPWFMEKNRLFTHAGFNPEYTLHETPKESFLWDRTLINYAVNFSKTKPDFKIAFYDEIYLGHTPTFNFGFDVPHKFCNVWAMDTGAGHGRRLSIMDIDTKEFWQSDVIKQNHIK